MSKYEARVLPVRACPACELLAAAPGDRYCEGCGSARDRSAWADMGEV